jgi:hypothetical protein
MANKVEIEFLIKAENAKIRQLSNDIQELTDDVKFQQITQGKLSAEERAGFLEHKAHLREKKALAAHRLADLRREQAQQRQMAAEERSNSRRAKMSYLGVGLSIMFAGQALRRFSEGALRSLINTYSEVMGKTSTFGIMTNRLAASWEFLKWSIMSALEQTGVMDAVIWAAQSLVNWFNQLGPIAKSSIGVLLLGMFLLGTVMSPIGQLVTAMSADWAMMGTNLKWLGSKLPAMLQWGGAIAVAYVATRMLFDVWTTEGTKTGKLITSMGIALAALGVGALIFGLAWGLPLLLIGSAILLGIAFKEELGIAFSYLIDGLLVLGNLLVKMLLTPLQKAIELFNLISRALGGPTIKWTPFKMVDEATVALGDWNADRRRQLQQDAINRGSPLNNIGLGGILGAGGAAQAVATPSTTTGAAAGSSTSNVINIQNAYVDQTSASMSRATESFNQALAGTPFGG